MRIDAFSVYKVPVTLVEPLRTSGGTHSQRDITLVCAESDGVFGWGENVAPLEPLYTSEYLETSLPVMIDEVIARVLQHDHVNLRDIRSIVAGIEGYEMAKYAVEMAVTDVWLRQQQLSLGSFIGATQHAVPVGVVVGMNEPRRLLQLVDQYLADGYRRIKLKIAPGRDVDVVRMVREHVGPDVVLQVDANCAYTAREIDHLRQLDEFDLQFIEQPFAADAFAEHAQFASRASTPVCLDESIITMADLQRVIDAGACSFVNIKPSRVGSVFTAIEMYEHCVSRGVEPWCGGMLESGIGRAALLTFAALPHFSITHDLSASARYFARDITAPFQLQEGTIAVPQGPGIGVVPDPHVIETAQLLVRVAR